jgi:hypothetical protein
MKLLACVAICKRRLQKRPPNWQATCSSGHQTGRPPVQAATKLAGHLFKRNALDTYLPLSGVHAYVPAEKGRNTTQRTTAWTVLSLTTHTPWL